MSNEFFALDSEGGEPLWNLQILMTIKASGDKTGGALGLLDFKTQTGKTPLQVDHKETECHLLQMAIPAGLEVFHKEMGQPAPRIELPPPGQVLDTEKYKRLAAEHGLEIIQLPQWDASKEGAK